MLLGNVTIGLEQLDVLKQSIQQANSDLSLCDEYKNVLLWSGVQKYMQVVLAKFEPKTGYAFDALAKAITELELEKTYVDIKRSFEENKIMLNDYIDKMSKKLG